MKKGIYKHYKGGLYLVDKVVKNSESEEEMVVYQCQYGDHSWWVRPKDMFVEKVIVGGEEVDRFEYVGISNYMYC